MPVTSLTSLVSNLSGPIRSAAARAALNTAQLSSGNRLIQASTDITALSIGTGLQSQVSSLRTAALNAAQAGSFLQVADGGASQIGEILQRMQALSVQANSGALSQSGREGLNREFQQLRGEIDRLSGNTNFSGVNLLDGSLSGGPGLQTDTSQGTRATASLNFTANIGAGQTLVLNGQTLTEGVNFNAGATISQTLDNLANSLNSSSNTNLSSATYTRVGNTLQITADAAGEIGNSFTINEAASTSAAAFNVGGQQLGATQVFSLQGGTDTGIFGNSVTASGIVGDNLVTAQNSTPASIRASFTSSANIVAGNTINVDDGNGGFTTLTFVNGPAANQNQISIGTSLEETLGNAAAAINNFSGPGDFGTSQLNARVEGNDLVIESRAGGNPVDAAGAALNVNITTAGGSVSGNTLNNGSTGGVDTRGVSNASFTGTISGFQATATGTDSATVSVRVGNETYTANITDTTPGANTTVRFSSANGGFFDVQLSAGNGQSINNQSDANTLAARFDASFSPLNFSQTRNVSNFSGTGQLSGASLQVRTGDFSDLSIDSVSATAVQPGGSTASFEVRINGETFRATNLGSQISAGESITLTSTTNSNNTLTFRNGTNRIDLTSATNAQTFEDSFSNAIGNGGSGGGATFQIGDSADQSVTFSIGDLSADSLLGDGSLDLLSGANAAQAAGAVTLAINSLTSARANIGSFQSALDYASANINSALQNQDAARSVFLDTDIPTTSTEFLRNQLLLQAGIAGQAQSNRLAPALLKLLVG